MFGKPALSTLALCWAALAAGAADWPQFMRNSRRDGNAPDEALTLPLGLAAQVRLDDAITTAPAVVGGRVYVVDQMGTAYCVDPAEGKIIWRAAPDGERAMGANTSSPCVAGGRVYYGTTAGSLHVLDAADGKVVRTIRLGWGVPGSPAFANGSIYFQTLGGVIHCIDPDGTEKWRWDHYAQCPPTGKGINKDGSEAVHYGGREVAVGGRYVVSTIGTDVFCLADDRGRPTLLWCERDGLRGEGGVGPMYCSIGGDFVYVGFPGSDGYGGVRRYPLRDPLDLSDRARAQEWAKANSADKCWNIVSTPAVRDQTAYVTKHASGVAYNTFGGERVTRGYTVGGAGIASPALTKDHCVTTTMAGELYVHALADWRSSKPFRFATPHGKPIGSSPAVADGKVYFGCDDGFLYVLAPDGRLEPRTERLTLHEPRTKASPATGKAYDWPDPGGGPANTGYVDDPALTPPFRLRWAVRSFGVFKQPVSAIGGDVVFFSMEGTAACHEQATGRLRWRRRLPTIWSTWQTSGVTCVGERLYFAFRAPFDERNKRRLAADGFGEHGKLICLDRATGGTLWSAETGKTSWVTQPVAQAGRVALGSIYLDADRKLVSVVEAWEGETGRKAWRVGLDLDEAKGEFGSANGCAAEGVMYFSRGDRAGGQTVAIDARDGRPLWRTKEAWGGGLAMLGERLYVIGTHLPMACLSAADGKLVWKTPRPYFMYFGPALGPGRDFLIARGRGGEEVHMGLDGKEVHIVRGQRVAPAGWTCAPAVLTSSGYYLATSVRGLAARDAATGKTLWQSKGFAIRACTSPAVAGGRIFYAPQVCNILFCFEPAGGGQ